MPERLKEKPPERPNYKLTYKAVSRFDNDDQYPSHFFRAANDNQAREIVSSLAQDWKKKAQIDWGDKSQTNWDHLICTPLRLERVNYVMVEKEETTPIPLQEDASSRLRNGIPIELL